MLEVLSNSADSSSSMNSPSDVIIPLLKSSFRRSAYSSWRFAWSSLSLSACVSFSTSSFREAIFFLIYAHIGFSSIFCWACVLSVSDFCLWPLYLSNLLRLPESNFDSFTALTNLSSASISNSFLDMIYSSCSLMARLMIFENPLRFRVFLMKHYETVLHMFDSQTLIAGLFFIILWEVVFSSWTLFLDKLDHVFCPQMLNVGHADDFDVFTVKSLSCCHQTQWKIPSFSGIKYSSQRTSMLLYKGQMHSGFSCQESIHFRLGLGLHTQHLEIYLGLIRGELK